MARQSLPWSAPDLRRRCRTLREQLSVAAADVVSPAEIEAYWPGGQENSVEGRGAWIYCYANYCRLADRMRPDHVAVDADEAERARVEGLTEKPQPVRLTDGQTVHVHPLGYEALEFLTTLDRAVTLAQEQAAAVALQCGPASEQVLALQPIVRAYAVRLWAWILTSGSTALPFDPIVDDPAPPAWTAALTPEDLLGLFAAHRAVNAQRNALIASLFPSSTEAPVKLSLAGFIGAYAHEKGQDARHFLRSFSIGKLFAQAVSAAQQHDAAMASARAKREDA